MLCCAVQPNVVRTDGCTRRVYNDESSLKMENGIVSYSLEWYNGLSVICSWKWRMYNAGRRQSIQSSGVDRSGSTRSCRSSRNYAQHQHHQHHQQQQHELGGGGGRRRDSSGPEGDPSASSSAEHLQPIN